MGTGRSDYMIKYLLRRLITWVLMIVAATNLTYFLASWALDPSANYAERRPPLSPEQIEANLELYNLGRQTPLLERWWHWISGIVLHWDWGSGPMGAVNPQVRYRMMISFELLIGATLLQVVIGCAIGVYTASRQYKFADRFFQGLSIILMNISIIVASIALVTAGIWVNTKAGATIFFVAGSSSNNDQHGFAAFVDLLQHLALPTLALVIIGYPSYHVLQRALLLDNLNADFVRTARAKGLTKHQAIRRHALRTSLIPIANSVAFSIPGIFTGAILTETLFAWQGMGSYLATSIGRNDIHGVVACSAFGALATAVGAMLADVATVFLDPRVRVS